MVVRPTSVTVFGILNIIFGLFGLMGMGFAIAMLVVMANADQKPPGFAMSPAAELYNRIAMGLGVVSTLMLLVSGFGLLGLRPWGRKLALAYAIYAIVSTFANIAITYVLIWRPLLEKIEEQNSPENTAAMFGFVGGMGGGCIGMIYPVLLWYFMTRPLVVAAFSGLSAAPPTDWSADPTQIANPALRDTSNPYLSPMTDTGPQMSSGESVIETLVPSKNGPALASYYLGLFSLFPCLGFFLAVPAVYYGIKGLRLVRSNPEVRGGVHAWVGVVCGSVFGLFNLLLLIGTTIGAVAAVMQN